LTGQDLSDARLISEAAAGNTGALGKLVHRHQAEVLALAFRILGRWDLAEEIARETFERVLGAGRTHGPDAKFTVWLVRIAVNLCFDTQRRRRIASGAPGDPAAAEGDAAPPAEAAERCETVRRAVAALPVRQRMMLILHRYQGLGRREIAFVTCCSTTAVESLLARAYANLQGPLRPPAEDDD